jgi:hypothetical protein
MPRETFNQQTKQWESDPVEETKTFDIWCEGYSVTGQEEKARKVAERVEGETFVDACWSWFKSHSDLHYDPEQNTAWGCQLFPTEAEARKSFG